MLRKSKPPSANGSALGAAADARDAAVARPGGEHAEAGIDRDHLARVADARLRRAGDEAGAARDVEHAHAGREPRARERFAAVPGARPAGHQRFDAVVVDRGAIEEPAHPRLAGGGLAVVAGQRRMRRQLLGHVRFTDGTRRRL